MIGTAGHIDHGKTALVRALTGVDTDRLPDERRRGLTIDIGFAYMELDGRRVGLVDVPGHERFVRNMLAGATGIDLALLVIAADDAIMPQTHEHLDILNVLGIQAGVIAISKTDLVDDDWLDLVVEDVRVLVRGTFLDDAPIIPTSSRTGHGLDALRAALGERLDALANVEDPGPFRMAVDRVFSAHGFGTVVTGTIASGSVTVADALELFPGRQTVRVRGIQQHGKSVDTLAFGNRAAINLAGIDHHDLTRGCLLATSGYLEPGSILNATLNVSANASRAIRDRGRYRLHLGTSEIHTKVVLLEPERLEPGDSGLVQILLAKPYPGVFDQPYVLREESPPSTIGGGRLLTVDHLPTRRVRRGDHPRLEGLRRLADPQISIQDRLRVVLAGLEGVAVSTLALCRMSGITVDRIPRLLEDLDREGALIRLDLGPTRTIRVPCEVVDDWQHRIERTLEALHRRRPRHPRVPYGELVEAVSKIGESGLIDAVIERMIASGSIRRRGQGVALARFEPQLSRPERALLDALTNAFREARWRPPDLDRLITMAGTKHPILGELIEILVEEGTLVEVGPKLWLHQEAEAMLRQTVADVLADDRSLTMAELRSLLEITRKHAVPFGEYLDRIGLTIREGDHRRLANPSPSASSPVPTPADPRTSRP